MRSKDFSTGLRGALFEAKHYERMGPAIWLYGWLVLRETPQAGSGGWVLGGKPISYREIESETDFSPRTLERWMRILRSEGYIETRTVPDGVVVRITKAKKFSRAPAARESAGPVRGNAEASPQNCVGDRADDEDAHAIAPRMSSGIVVREEKDKATGLVKNEKAQASAGSAASINAGPAANTNGRNANANGRDAANANGRDAAMAWRHAKEEMLQRELGTGQGPQLTRRESARDGNDTRE